MIRSSKRNLTMRMISQVESMRRSTVLTTVLKKTIRNKPREEFMPETLQ